MFINILNNKMKNQQIFNEKMVYIDENMFFSQYTSFLC